ncbi:hypothetical protein [Syntrophorhabdus aromaticivorans]|uniref:hypothetical protein n=1 Tax=Syntrophorhabdus aromaticivorans TaxID=328301 RepID=UPI00041F8E07|nr:hypothetical protein [Syntrophorhabdus aromaticivorans]HBA53684.1 hypothetical protein [Syntrophorhabdus aromaticivorans]
MIAALEEERLPLVLSDRKDHLELLLAEITAMQTDKHIASFLVAGDTGKRMRNRMMEEIRAMRGRGELPFLLSTGSLVGEGFDLPELCTLPDPGHAVIVQGAPCAIRRTAPPGKRRKE